MSLTRPPAADPLPERDRTDDLAAAEQRYRRIVEANPRLVDARHRLGVICLRRGKVSEAVALLEAAVAMNPLAPGLMSDLAEALLRHRAYDRALAILDQLVKVQPDDRDVWSQRGLALWRLQRLEDAIAAFDRAIALDGAASHLHFHRARALYALHRQEDALSAFNRGLQLDADDAEAWHARGIILKGLGRTAEALASEERALALRPSWLPPTLERAQLLTGVDRREEALVAFRRAMEIDANSLVAQQGIGEVALSLGRFEDALAAFDQVIARDPDHLAVRRQRALAALSLGRYRDAWADFSADERSGSRDGRPALASRESLRGRSVLVRASNSIEQTLLFSRLVPVLARSGADVVLEVMPEVRPIVAGVTAQGVRRVVTPSETVGEKFDAVVPLCELPRILELDAESIPREAIAAAIEAARVAAWSQRLPTKTRARIGWAGTRKLQERLATLPVDVVDLQPPGAALIDSAALMLLVDLIVTAEPLIAQIAAGMGRPAWALVPAVPEWYWGTSGDRTPWYPTLRLFRQEVAGSWTETIQAVAAALGDVLRRPEGLTIEAAVTNTPPAPASVPAPRTSMPPAVEPSLARPMRRLRDVDALLGANRFREAEDLLRSRLSADPNEFGTLLMLAKTLLLCGQPAASLSFAERGIASRADHVELLVYRAQALLELGRWDAALHSFDLAIGHRADHVAAHVGKASALLATGQLAAGWAEYEWRLGRAPRASSPPEWTDRIVHLFAGATIAETLFFLRFVPAAVATGARLTLEVAPELVALAQSISGVERVIASGVPNPSDVHEAGALGSLPYRLRLSSLVAQTPYLRVPPPEVERARRQLSKPRRKSIGVAWRGTSGALAALASLPSNLDVDFVSLEREPTSDELGQWGRAGGLQQHPVSNLTDLAALISALDAVISPDGVVAHLAGALGRPLIVLHASAADWQWMAVNGVATWYPTATICKPDRDGAWHSAIKVIGDMMKQWRNAGSPAVTAIPSSGVVADPHQLVTTRHGPMLVNRNDQSIGRALVEYGECMAHEGQLLEQMWRARPGCVIDIGANLGVLSIPLARALASEGRELVAIEPQPTLFRLLCANLAISGIKNVTTLPFACAAHAGLIELASIDPDRPGEFVRPAGVEEAVGPTMRVEARRLDEVVGERTVGMMRIDAAGRELQVLEGATRIVARFRPVLYVSNPRADRSQALIEWLWSKGYQLWWHVPPRFNPRNFAGNPDNRFGTTVGVYLLAIPRAIEAKVEGLSPVDDALVHPLKPRLESRRPGERRA